MYTIGNLTRNIGKTQKINFIPFLCFPHVQPGKKKMLASFLQDSYTQFKI